jgi:hypothetical protein
MTLAGCGCLDLLSIKGTSATQHNGIPFYLKVGMCRQETVWVEPVLELKLERREQAPESAKKTTGTTTAEPAWVTVSTLIQYVPWSRDQATTDCGTATGIEALLCTLGDPKTTDPKDITGAWQKLGGRATPYPTTTPATGNALMASNKTVVEAYVDYAHPLYYNGKMPWLGSSKATIGLNPDGTLASAESDAEPKVLQSLLDLLPVSAFLSAKLIPKAAVAAAATGNKIYRSPIIIPPRDTKVRFDLTVTSVIFKHTLRTTLPLDSGTPRVSGEAQGSGAAHDSDVAKDHFDATGPGLCRLREPLVLDAHGAYGKDPKSFYEYTFEQLPITQPADDGGKVKAKDDAKPAADNSSKGKDGTD